MKNRTTRRNFLKSMAMGTAALHAPGMLGSLKYTPFTKNQTISPNSMIQIALIGKGGMGTSDTRTALETGEVKLVAVCDLYDKRLEEAKKLWGDDLFLTKDYRDILARRDVDAVIIATPDHWHHPISIDAMKEGKHVYCEKPIIHKLHEGTDLIHAQKKSGIYFQIGSQGMASVGNKIAKVLVQNGTIGKVNLIDGQFSSPPRSLSTYHPPLDATTDTIWWKQFLGNAPEIPFNPQKFFAWRNWKDYGTTIAGDLFVHVISSVHYIMDTPGPRKIYTTGGIHHYTDGSRDTPDIMLGYLDYPNHHDLGAFTLSMGANYVDGISNKWGSMDFLITGSQGTLQVGWNNIVLKTTYDLDEKDVAIKDQVGEHLGGIHKISPREYSFHATDNYRGGHYHHFLNFFNGIREGNPLVADVNFGVRSSAPALLCYDSYIQEKAIHWDPSNLQIIN